MAEEQIEDPRHPPKVGERHFSGLLDDQSNLGRDSEPRLKQVLNRAAAVIGDNEEALRWMGTPVRALGFATPISLLGTDEGAQEVFTVLGRLEHGIF